MSELHSALTSAIVSFSLPGMTTIVPRLPPRDRVSEKAHLRQSRTQRQGILLVATSGLLMLATSSWAQEHTLKQLLSGDVHPLRVILKDLGPDWRRVSISSAAMASDNVSVNVSGNTGGSTSQNNLTGAALAGSRIYLTQGQTISAAGGQYLVAYHMPAAALDIGTLVQALATKTPPASTLLTPDSALPLSLLDLRTIGSLEDVRVFDLDAEIKESERAAALVAGLFKAPEQKDDAQAQVRQRLQEVLKAAETKDFARLDSYHLYGPKFTKFDARAPGRLNADAAKQGEHNGLSAVEDLSLTTDDLKIDVFGETAVATCIIRAKGNHDGELFDSTERGTLVLVKDSGAWKIVHEHFSPATPATP